MPLTLSTNLCRLKRAQGKIGTSLAHIPHTLVEGRNEQTRTLPELRSLRCGYVREYGFNLCRSTEKTAFALFRRTLRNAG
jgi:hypothetical protein